MKIKTILTAILLMCSFIAVQAQDNIFDKLSDHNEISVVYISKSLLKMMPENATIGGNVGGTNMKGLVNKLEQMEIYNSKDAEAMKLIRTEMDKIAKSKNYESLMSLKEKGENIKFYTHKEKDLIKDLIMYVNDANSCSIIRILGSFTTEDVQKVMDSKK